MDKRPKDRGGIYK